MSPAEDVTKKKYRIEFPIFETKKEIRLCLRRMVEDMKKVGIEVNILGKIETEKIPLSEYPPEVEKRLIDKYESGELRKEVEGNLLELEYGIKIV